MKLECLSGVESARLEYLQYCQRIIRKEITPFNPFAFRWTKEMDEELTDLELKQMGLSEALSAK